jgi:hypothetical protein
MRFESLKGDRLWVSTRLHMILSAVMGCLCLDAGERHGPEALSSIWAKFPTASARKPTWH